MGDWDQVEVAVGPLARSGCDGEVDVGEQAHRAPANAVVSRASVRRRMERLTGLVMIGFGVRLAIERR
jgi:hypothetical protein